MKNSRHHGRCPGIPPQIKAHPNFCAISFHQLILSCCCHLRWCLQAMIRGRQLRNAAIQRLLPPPNRLIHHGLRSSRGWLCLSANGVLQCGRDHFCHCCGMGQNSNMTQEIDWLTLLVAANAACWFGPCRAKAIDARQI